MDGATKQNPFVMAITNIFFFAIPSLRKSCPVSGSIKILNFTISGDMFKFVAKGVLRVNLHFYSKSEDIILWMNYIYAKTSSRAL